MYKDVNTFWKTCKLIKAYNGGQDKHSGNKDYPDKMFADAKEALGRELTKSDIEYIMGARFYCRITGYTYPDENGELKLQYFA